MTDILNKKINILLPEIAEGIFAEDSIPQGDFSIIPPVYFDRDVQVECGSIIGPNTIMMKETLVSKNSNIKNSVLLNGCFVSSDCYVDGVLMSDNVSVRRNSIILSESVLGGNCFVGEESVVENESLIKPFTRIDNFKKIFINYKRETNQSRAGFYGYTPEKAALLGASIGIVFEKSKIAVASDGELNSLALKLALLGGMITTGASCYDFGNSFMSSLHYFMEFCELDCAVFVSGNKSGTIITVFQSGGYSLNSAQYHNIKMIMTSDNIRRCDYEECKNVRQIHGMKRMYIQNLIKDFYSKLSVFPVIKCDNKIIQNVVDIALSKIGYEADGEIIVFNINYDGTRAIVEYDSVVYPHKKLLEIMRYYNGGNTESKALWSVDAVSLCFELMRVLLVNELTLDKALKELPPFYIAESTFEYNGKISTILNKIGDANKIRIDGDDILIKKGENKLKITKNDTGQLKIIAKSNTVETAEELVGELLKKLS